MNGSDGGRAGSAHRDNCHVDFVTRGTDAPRRNGLSCAGDGSLATLPTARRKETGENSVPLIRFDSVSKRYGTVVALDSLDLEISPGQLVALLGPNGAGKSTALSLVLGLRRPTSGRLEVLGLTPDEAVSRGQVAAVLQTGALPPGLTPRELVSFARRLYERPIPVEEALRQAGCTTFARASVDRLSGGQVQRVRFAMALVGQPRLMVLDEPTVGMDVETRRQFWSSVRDMAGDGRGIVFSTHYLDEADDHADRIVVLQAGRIVADGTAQSVRGQVAGRVIQFHINPGPGSDPSGALRDALARLPGVVAAQMTGTQVTLQSVTSDLTVRALTAMPLDWSDLEIRGSGLEEAFIALTAGSSGTQAPQGNRQNTTIGGNPS